METIKELLIFCNAAVFYEFKNLGIFDEFSQALRDLFNNFDETVTVERILKTLSIIDDIISKITNNDVDEVIDNIRDLRSNIIYMVGFEKVVKVDVDKVKN